MKKEVIILIAEDDEGHAALIRKNLERAGIMNQIIRFIDGQEALDFFFSTTGENHWERSRSYLLLLDIRMPKVDGVEILKRLKTHEEFKKIPVIMVTTTDDPREINNCHANGCSSYVVKPVDYEKFTAAIRQLGLFLLVVEVPTIAGDGSSSPVVHT